MMHTDDIYCNGLACLIRSELRRFRTLSDILARSGSADEEKTSYLTLYKAYETQYAHICRLVALYNELTGSAFCTTDFMDKEDC